MHTFCQCGADKNKTPHANDCPVVLSIRIAELERVIALQKKLIDELSVPSVPPSAA